MRFKKGISQLDVGEGEGDTRWLGKVRETRDAVLCNAIIQIYALFVCATDDLVSSSIQIFALFVCATDDLVSLSAAHML